MPGTLDKITPSRARKMKMPEKVRIVIDGPETLQIENTLIDKYGDDVSLKKRAHVEVTVTTKEVNWRG
jgi:hypothetical protein